SIQIDETSDVADHCQRIAAKLSLRCIQGFRIAARNRHAGAFGDEGLGGCQADSAVTAGNKGKLSCKSWHDHLQRMELMYTAFSRRWNDAVRGRMQAVRLAT